MKTIIISILLLNFIIPINAQNQILNNSIIPIEIRCVHFKAESVIIKNQEEYEALYNSFNLFSECENYTLPKIDFDRFILIGILTSTGGGKIKISEDL
jgi:hypothetical protein